MSEDVILTHILRVISVPIMLMGAALVVTGIIKPAAPWWFLYFTGPIWTGAGIYLFAITTSHLQRAKLGETTNFDKRARVMRTTRQ
jgi:hypothetical protein